MKPVLLDTGVIVASLDRGEHFHQPCADLLRDLQAPLVTCEAVVAESCYLLRSLPGAPEAVIQNVIAGMFQIPSQLSLEAASIMQRLQKYRDREIDLPDACLIRLADLLQSGDILTLDSDFRVYRRGRISRFVSC